MLIRSRFKKEKRENLVISSTWLQNITSSILKQGKTLTSIISHGWRWALPLVYKYKLKKRGDIMSPGNVQKQYQHIFKFHPNINLDYFKVIDTKEKAYWLGWLFAEGWMSMQKNGIRFGVEISIKEEILIDRFINAIGFNPKYKKHRYNTKVGIRLLNSQFTNNLEKHGFIIGRAKSKSIQLPKLSSRELYLAFLLGYYDGDGKVRSSRITCGSKEFLIQIQQLFALNYKIAKKTSGGPIEGREIHGECFEMGFGKDLFNDMLDNYQFSLPRKRNYL
ncbi:MAG: hypothetical protein CEE43_01850 [Promethearchaeota archaeon Loki_b32]|nr:MAG: hypothetical protein CEE43_01850 [Candidatus Lokiarchaeota archaeon Loki_b32]